MSTIIRKHAAVMDKKVHVAMACSFCGRNDTVLSLLVDKWACPHCRLVVIETNVFLKAAQRSVLWLEKAIDRVNDTMTNLPFIKRVAESIARQAFHSTTVLAEATRRTIRLYHVEGKNLSMKGGDQSRITWYTSKETAQHPTVCVYPGRLVYIDITLDCTSPYSHRFYKLNDEAYILQDELVRWSKRNYKYVREAN